MNKPSDLPDDLVRYKQILDRVIATRPSGIRRRLADALHKHPSFVSQITNPAYPTPVPPADVITIFEICHFSTADRRAFLEAYRAAHPRRSQHLFADDTPAERTLTLKVPDFGDRALNEAYDEILRRTARQFADFTALTTSTKGEQ